MTACDGVKCVSAALTCQNCAVTSTLSHLQLAVIRLQTSTSKFHVSEQKMCVSFSIPSCPSAFFCCDLDFPVPMCPLTRPPLAPCTAAAIEPLMYLVFCCCHPPLLYCRCCPRQDGHPAARPSHGGGALQAAAPQLRVHRSGEATG